MPVVLRVRRVPVWEIFFCESLKGFWLSSLTPAQLSIWPAALGRACGFSLPPPLWSISESFFGVFDVKRVVNSFSYQSYLVSLAQGARLQEIDSTSVSLLSCMCCVSREAVGRCSRD